jgi:hypothetical protein
MSASAAGADSGATTSGSCGGFDVRFVPRGRHLRSGRRSVNSFQNRHERHDDEDMTIVTASVVPTSPIGRGGSSLPQSFFDLSHRDYTTLRARNSAIDASS